MADLITPQELATWTQNDLADVVEDPYAIEVMEKVSNLARFLGGHDDWTISTAPFDVKLVVLMVCKRAYANPDQEVASGLGPISSRVLDVAALLLDLTESERSTLTKYNLTGDPDNKTASLWVMTTTNPSPLLRDVTLYVGDDQQINLASSADPREWMIPLFNPGDPGDPSHYSED